MFVGLARGASLLWPALGLGAALLVYRLTVPNPFHGLFIDYWFHFAVGVVLYHRLCHFRRRVDRAITDGGFLVLAAVGAAALAMPAATWVDPPLAWELLVIGGFAHVLAATRGASSWVMSSPFGRALAGLGAVSYSLYLVHQFNLRFASTVADKLLPATAPEVLNRMVQLAVHIAIAAVFWYLCERPFLNPRLEPARPASEPLRAEASRVGESG